MLFKVLGQLELGAPRSPVNGKVYNTQRSLLSKQNLEEAVKARRQGGVVVGMGVGEARRTEIPMTLQLCLQRKKQNKKTLLEVDEKVQRIQRKCQF